MTDWLVDLLISEFIHRYFDVMAAFRFSPYCVNYSFSMFFWALLQNHNLRGAAGNDVITDITVVFEIRRFPPIILIGGHFNFWSIPKG